MLHARKDYNRRVQDSENKIPQDEPVFLLRGNDHFAIPILYEYIRHLRAMPVRNKENFNVEIGTLRQIVLMLLWQMNPDHSHRPDCPEDELE